MSTDDDRSKKRNRLQQDENAIFKQLRIANHRGGAASKAVEQPHRLRKHRYMDCGNPKCALCGNPRRVHKDKLTVQEHRLFQDLELANSKKSNGLANDQDD